MKKNILIIAGITLGIGFFMSSCKSSYESAYRTAQKKDVGYSDKDEEVTIYTPPITTPEQEDYVPTRTEKISSITQDEASNLKRYNVVIYSFKNKTNANAAKEEMIKHGYNVILAQNEDDMYRVIIASYDDKASAVAKRNEVKAKYAPRFDDIWILERTY